MKEVEIGYPMAAILARKMEEVRGEGAVRTVEALQSREKWIEDCVTLFLGKVYCRERIDDRRQKLPFKT